MDQWSDIQINLAFPHRYEVEPEPELPSKPGEIKQIYYPGAAEKGGRGGIAVKIMPFEGPIWIGTFASGNYPKTLSGIFSCPDERSICVVSSGQAYIVRTDAPQSWEEVRPFPVRGVHPILEANLLVFEDFTRLTAYGTGGVVWATPDLSWDGLKITEVTGDQIKGLAWDASQEQEVEFLVEVRTGRHTGGSSPRMYMFPTKSARARIKWIPFDLGGRKRPPVAPRYSTVIHFEGDTEWPKDAWSIVVDFDDTPDKSLEIIANVWFLAYENAAVPNHFLEPGNHFELVEGAKIVAKGEIIEVSNIAGKSSESQRDSKPIRKSEAKTNLWDWFKAGISAPKITKAEAIAIARVECERRDLPWREPVVVMTEWGTWIVLTSADWLGGNVRIFVRKDTGEVTKVLVSPK